MASRPDTADTQRDCRPGYQWYVCGNSGGTMVYSGCCSIDPCSTNNYCPVQSQETSSSTVVVQTLNVGVTPATTSILQQSTTTIQPSTTSIIPQVLGLPSTPGPVDETTTSSTHSPSVGVIVAACVSSVVGVAILIALWVWLCCARRRDSQRNRGWPDWDDNKSIDNGGYGRGESPHPLPPPLPNPGGRPSPPLEPVYVPIKPRRPDAGGAVSVNFIHLPEWRWRERPRSEEKRHRDKSKTRSAKEFGIPHRKTLDSMDVRLTPLDLTSTTAIFKADLVGYNRTRSSSLKEPRSSSRHHPRGRSHSHSRPDRPHSRSRVPRSTNVPPGSESHTMVDGSEPGIPVFPTGRTRYRRPVAESESSASELLPVEMWARSKGYMGTGRNNVWYRPGTGRTEHAAGFGRRRGMTGKGGRGGDGGIGV